VAEKREGNELPKIVYKYETGDYFGELALINNEPRQASIRAVTSAKLAYVTSEGFKRVFGTIT
jgi:cAMP-dependent protein kinase regulator